MENDFNSYSPYMNYGSNQMANEDFGNGIYSDPSNFNPIMQYEQAYTYYRFLCMQMDYKIKCKEYEKLCGKNNNNNNSNNNSSGNSRPR